MSMYFGDVCFQDEHCDDKKEQGVITSTFENSISPTPKNSLLPLQRIRTYLYREIYTQDERQNH
jgi:hypothetical protein